MLFELKNKETIALFKLYVIASESHQHKKDWRFIKELERLTAKELKKIFYELNNVDYEKEYLPKSYQRYKIMNKITEKMSRLKNFFVAKYLTNDD